MSVAEGPASNASASSATRRGSQLRGWVVTLIGVALVLLVVAAVMLLRPTDQLDTTYGKRRGTPGGPSVNGTAVLAEMFRQAGFDVSSWRRLSPRLERSDVIVWAPDDFQPPTVEQQDFIEAWLEEEPGRTLVYIGRDYDAAGEYWSSVAGDAPPDQLFEVMRRAAMARSEHARRRAEMPENHYARWFTMQRDGARRTVRKLDTSTPWADDVNVQAADIEVAGQLAIPEQEDAASADEFDDLLEYEVLLATEEEPLVMRVTYPWWDGSQILVVANGSFLLNLPLTNPEHRELAAKLIAACRPAEEVVFLESGPGGPAVMDDDPNARQPTGLELLTEWPQGAIGLHLVVLGILFCFAVFPIFGRPHDLPPPSQSDFGHHVRALGDLLARTRDQAYAVSKLQHYQQFVRGDAEPGQPVASPSVEPQQTTDVAAADTGRSGSDQIN